MPVDSSSRRRLLAQLFNPEPVTLDKLRTGIALHKELEERLREQQKAEQDCLEGLTGLWRHL